MTTNNHQLGFELKDNLYFVTNKFNLMTILSSGELTVSEFSYRYVEDTRELTKGRFILWTSPVPSELLDEGNILVEISCDFLDYLRKSLGKKQLKIGRYILPSIPVPAVFIESFLFRSDEEREEFLLRLFDDVPIAPEQLGVISEVDVTSQPIGKITLPKQEFAAMAGFDKLAGALLLSTQLVNPSLENLSLTKWLYDFFRPKSTQNKKDKKEFFISEADKWLLSELKHILLTLNPDKGMDKKAILKFLVDSAQDKPASIAGQINKWGNYVARIINAEADFHSLDDQGSIVQRGIMLFLLRPDAGRIEESRTSLLRPGPKVQTVGAFLCGYYVGATRLPISFKSCPEKYNKAIFTLQKGWLSRTEKGCKMHIDTIRVNNESYSFVVSISDDCFIKLPYQFEGVERSITNMANQYGLEFIFDFSLGGFWYRPESIGESDFKAFITAKKTKRAGFQSIQITVPCYSLRGRARFLKKDAIELLNRNASDEMNGCWYGKSIKHKAVTVSTEYSFQMFEAEHLMERLETVIELAKQYIEERAK